MGKSNKLSSEIIKIYEAWEKMVVEPDKVN